MASRVTVTVKDGQPYYPHKVVTRVGILEPGATHEGAGMTVGDLAAKHEFGEGPVPPRAPIAKMSLEKGPSLQKLGTRLFETAAKEGAPAAYRKAAALLAVKAGAEIRNVITEGLTPPLAELTKKLKLERGYKPPYTPLVETGVLRSHYVGDSEVS
jgi:hypothetical protein